MEIYHGSDIEIKDPKIFSGKYTKDFGDGFYCTVIKEQAIRWASRYDTPVVNTYNCIIDSSKLKVKDFGEPNDEWLDFIVNCRMGKPHDYDIVIGAMADDRIYNYVNDFAAGLISREQFWVMMKFNHPTHQILFHTPQSLRSVSFIKSERV